tara:strand:+ start:5252 stop:5404 length:153 start_codon:yes stop_codon:yes gene_type:complete
MLELLKESLDAAPEAVPSKFTQAFAALCLVSVTGLEPSDATIVSAFNVLI